MSAGESHSTLILAHARSRPARVARVAAAAPTPVRWLLLDEDYLRQLKWRAALGHDRTVLAQDSRGLPPVAELIQPGPLIARAAEELRHPFLDEITKLGRRHNSPAWWASRVSERNTAATSLFLHCCYLKLASEQLASAASLVVICQSWAVLEALATLAAERGVRALWASRRIPGGATLERAARIATRIGLFLTRGALQALLAPPRPQANSPRCALLRTWVDRGSVGTGGVFTDRYFPGLAEWLERRGVAALTIPALGTYEGSHRGAWRRLRATSQRFLAPESYYRPGDYTFALREARRAARMPRGRIAVGELDVSRVFEEERRRDAYDRGTLDALLSHRLPLRLARAGLEFDLVVDVYENMIPEKPFSLGLRRYMPAARIVGFQHGALYPNLLCNFVSAGEAEFAPLPDRVVCNGEFFRDVLVRAGLPAERAFVGPALRYRHLWRETRRKLEAGGEPTILVPLPLVVANSIELLHKLCAALRDVHTRVLLKPHPMAPTEKMLRTAASRDLPAHFRFVEEPMGELLPRARIVIAIASSALYEALTAGVPVVVVGREASLDLNPLAWEPGIGEVFREPAAIRAEALRLLALSDAELAAYRERAAAVLCRSFNPVSDETMRSFVDGLIELPEATLATTGSP